MAARRPFLDRLVARAIALVVAIACGAALAWYHRDDLFPPEAAEAPGDDRFARCYAERAGDVEHMLEEGVIDEAKAARFRERAEAFCRAQTGG